MAVITIGYSRIVFAYFEMTDKAAAFSDSDVFSLDNLRVTTRTPELLTSSEILKMNFMVKSDLFESNNALQEPFIVAPFLKTAFVWYFSPGL